MISRKRRRKEMRTTMVVSEAKAVPPVVSSIQDIPLKNIRESKTNPRGFFDQTKLAQLAENIRQHGVLQPILVRPLPQTDGQQSTPLSRGATEVHLIVKWNSFWQEDSPGMVVRLAEAGLYASLASPGTRACDAVGGAFRPEWREGPVKVF
jgi:hypothetical protein